MGEGLPCWGLGATVHTAKMNISIVSGRDLMVKKEEHTVLMEVLREDSVHRRARPTWCFSRWYPCIAIPFAVELTTDRKSRKAVFHAPVKNAALDGDLRFVDVPTVAAGLGQRA